MSNKMPICKNKLKFITSTNLYLNRFLKLNLKMASFTNIYIFIVNLYTLYYVMLNVLINGMCNSDIFK